MSGGSYDYLCHAEFDSLLHNQSNLQDMVDRLAGLGYAEDAANEAQMLLLTIRQYETRVSAMQSRLSGVFKAVEWWDSCDSDEESVKQALKEYRGE